MLGYQMSAVTEAELSRVFDKALANGPNSLSPAERRLYLIQAFILEWEMGSLSGYFYNRLPDVPVLEETIIAMRSHEFDLLADILDEAVGLFRDYRDPDPPTTWTEV